MRTLKVGEPAPTSVAPMPAERAENFPVALWLLPAGLRADLHAVYAFARSTDELGDSAPGDRVALLEDRRTELDRIWTGGPLADPVVRGLAPVVRRHRLDPAPFRALVEANLVDQRVTRYAGWAELLDYCRLSAEPVGRIVLGLFGVDDPVTGLLSDRVCAALQVLEHCQDVGEDARAGRIYLPADGRALHRVSEDDLLAPAASPALRHLVLETVGHASALLEDGAPVVDRLDGWARVCVAGFVAGGRATVTALRRTGGDVLGRSARPSRAETALRGLGLVVAGAGRRPR